MSSVTVLRTQQNGPAVIIQSNGPEHSRSQEVMLTAGCPSTPMQWPH